MPVVGDRVMVGTSDTVWTVLSISHSGKEVNLHIPNTTLQRFRVMISDLRFLDSPSAPKPKEPPKPEIDKEDVREHLVSTQHSSMHNFEGDIALLKKYLKSKAFLPPQRTNWMTCIWTSRTDGMALSNRSWTSWGDRIMQPPEW